MGWTFLFQCVLNVFLYLTSQLFPVAAAGWHGCRSSRWDRTATALWVPSPPAARDCGLGTGWDGRRVILDLLMVAQKVLQPGEQDEGLAQWGCRKAAGSTARQGGPDTVLQCSAWRRF